MFRHAHWRIQRRFFLPTENMVSSDKKTTLFDNLNFVEFHSPGVSYVRHLPVFSYDNEVRFFYLCGSEKLLNKLQNRLFSALEFFVNFLFGISDAGTENEADFGIAVTIFFPCITQNGLDVFRKLIDRCFQKEVLQISLLSTFRDLRC